MLIYGPDYSNADCEQLSRRNITQKKKPVAEDNGLSRMNRFGELEGNFGSYNQPARLAVSEARITEAGALQLQSGVFHERIDAEEVRMVEDVNCGSVKIEANALSKFEPLKYGDAGGV